MTILETIAFVLIVLAALMSFYRLIFGPTNPDRIISADALSLIATVVLVFLALIFDSPLYLDIALIYAVLAFIGIIALSRVIESGIKTSPLSIKENIANVLPKSKDKD
jgi:multicomponent Na+:H+ antiporter subunit F